MANKFKPHLHIVPEDDANRQVVNSLLLGLGVDTAKVKVFGTARGWLHVLESFERDHQAGMRRYPERFFALVLDFDDDPDRPAYAKSQIPEDLRDRVFILGSSKEPQDLKPDLGSFDDVGERLAKDCLEGTVVTWSHPLLAINLPEVRRFQATVCRDLF